MRTIDHDKRNILILEASAKLAKEKGIMGLRREDIAINCDLSDGLINRSFGTIYKLRLALVNYAIQHEITEILAEALVSRDTPMRNAAKKAPEALKRRIVESLI